MTGGWPTSENAIAQIDFRAGFLDPTDTDTSVPAIFKRAMKLHIEAHYNRDEKMMEKLITAARNLLRSAGEIEPVVA